MITPGKLMKANFATVPGDLPQFDLGTFGDRSGSDPVAQTGFGAALGPLAATAAKAPAFRPFYPHTRGTLAALGVLPATVLIGDEVHADPASSADPAFAAFVLGYEAPNAWGRPGAVVRPPRTLVVTCYDSRDDFVTAFAPLWAATLKPLGVSVYFASDFDNRSGANSIVYFNSNPILGPVPILGGTLAPVPLIDTGGGFPDKRLIGLADLTGYDPEKYDGGELFWATFGLPLGTTLTTGYNETLAFYVAGAWGFGDPEPTPIATPPGFTLAATNAIPPPGVGEFGSVTWLYVSTDMGKYGSLLAAFAARCAKFGWHLVYSTAGGPLAAGSPSDVLDPIVAAIAPVAAAYEEAADASDGAAKIAAAAAAFFG